MGIAKVLVSEVRLRVETRETEVNSGGGTIAFGRLRGPSPAVLLVGALCVRSCVRRCPLNVLGRHVMTPETRQCTTLSLPVVEPLPFEFANPRCSWPLRRSRSVAPFMPYCSSIRAIIPLSRLTSSTSSSTTRSISV